MWICEICEMQNEEQNTVCNICGAERPVRVLFPGSTPPAPDLNKTVYAPQPEMQNNIQPQAAPFGVLPDGTPIPAARPRPANMQPGTMEEPPTAPAPAPAAPVIEPPPFRPVEGADKAFRWGSPAEAQPPAPSVELNTARPVSPAVPPIRPSAPARTVSAKPEKPKRSSAAKPAAKSAAASKSTKTARMVVRAALIVANLGMIVWNVINISGVLM